MRTTCSRSYTKTFPSPIFPVRAAPSTASMTRSTRSSETAASIFTLGRKSTTYSAPRYSSVWPFWRPKPLTSVTVMPCTPMPESDSRTSSSLKGLMMAVTSFMLAPSGTRGSEVVRVLDADDRTGLAHELAVHRAGVEALVGVGVDVGERGGEAVAEVLAQGQRPVGIAGDAEVVHALVADVRRQRQAPPGQIEGGAEVEVAAALGVLVRGEVVVAEQVGQRVRVLERRRS